MPNPFIKAWKYVVAQCNTAIDEHADPKVQIQQAIIDAQRAHQALIQRAAPIVAARRQLEMRLNHQLVDIEKLQAAIREAVRLADTAADAGDPTTAAKLNNTAHTLAVELVTAEQNMEGLKGLHDQALAAAAHASNAVARNAMVLQEMLAERARLFTQLEQAKMQEQVSASLRSMGELAAPASTPSLAEIRDRIAQRYATALGAAELSQIQRHAAASAELTDTGWAGRLRLEQIRASVRGHSLPVAEQT